MTIVTTRATTKQHGVVRIAKPGESSPSAVVPSDDPRLLDPGVPLSQGRMLPPISILPAPSFGVDNDWVIYTGTFALYYKNPSFGWQVIGYIAQSVTNTKARFKCPDGTTRGATLTT